MQAPSNSPPLVPIPGGVPVSSVALVAVVRPAAALAGITLGCIGVLMLGLQPLLLGWLLEEHRLSVAQLTQAAMLEQLALGIVAGALGAFAPRRRLRLLACVGCGLVAAGNAGCLGAHGMSFVLWRAVSGSGGGVLLWIAGGIIAFSQAPARLSGIFVGTQAVWQCALAALLPVTLIPIWGTNGGFTSLAVLSVASIALVRLLPSGLPELVKQDVGPARLGLGAYAGLTASFFFMAAIVGFWVFVEPLGASSSISASVARFAVASNLAAQFVGAALAIILARRLVPVVTWVLAGSCLLLLTALGLVSGNPHNAAFLTAVLLHGLVWTLGLTFYVPLLIRVDPSRRGAMLLSGAEMLGGSAGPIVTGLFATETRLTPVLVSAALLALVALVSTVVASRYPGGNPKPIGRSPDSSGPTFAKAQATRERPPDLS